MVSPFSFASHTTCNNDGDADDFLVVDGGDGASISVGVIKKTIDFLWRLSEVEA